MNSYKLYQIITICILLTTNLAMCMAYFLAPLSPYYDYKKAIFESTLYNEVAPKLNFIYISTYILNMVCLIVILLLVIYSARFKSNTILTYSLLIFMVTVISLYYFTIGNGGIKDMIKIVKLFTTIPNKLSDKFLSKLENSDLWKDKANTGEKDEYGNDVNTVTRVSIGAITGLQITNYILTILGSMSFIIIPNLA